MYYVSQFGTLYTAGTETIAVLYYYGVLNL